MEEEIWKKHPEIDERYEFSNLGNFKEVNKNFNLKKTNDNGTGYATFLKVKNKKYRKRFKLHRIVAELFIPNLDTNKKLVKHKDGNRKNNIASNLEWVTETESVNIERR